MISPNLNTFYSTNFKLPIHLDDTVTRFYFFKDMNCEKINSMTKIALQKLICNDFLDAQELRIRFLV